MLPLQIPPPFWQLPAEAHQAEESTTPSLHAERGGSEDDKARASEAHLHCVASADPLFPMAAPYGGAPSAPPAPLAVVGPQFCAPYVVPLTVAKKAISLSDGDFTVTDANGGVVLRVRGAIFSVHRRRVLVDAAGYPVLTMAEKVFSLHNRWEVYRGDSTNASDLLFTAKKASVIQLKTAIDVFLAGNSSEHVCDFKIRGSYFERSCTFYLGNSDTMIAQMNRKITMANVLLEKDTFNVTVFPQVDYVFIAALVVILDEIHRERFD